MTAVLVAPPASEPVSLDEARAFLRLDTDAEDVLVASLVTAARAHVEGLTGRALITQGWRICREGWPRAGVMRLAPAPIVSVDAVTVFGADGTPGVVDAAAWQAELRADPARLRFRPAALDRNADNGIEVDVTAGYGTTADDVPAPLRQAIRMLLAFWFEHREAASTEAVTPDIAHGVWSLVAPYRVVGL